MRPLLPLTLLLAVPPLVDWKMLLPCTSCVAFESLAAHAAAQGDFEGMFGACSARDAARGMPSLVHARTK